MELFIAPTFALDQFARTNIRNEAAEYCENGCFSSHQLALILPDVASSEYSMSFQLCSRIS
jgi:hypothetical protein